MGAELNLERIKKNFSKIVDNINQDIADFTDYEPKPKTFPPFFVKLGVVNAFNVKSAGRS